MMTLWNGKLSTGYAELDVHHHELGEVYRHVLRCRRDLELAALSDTLACFESYLHRHFAAEERYMIATQDKSESDHAREHRSLLQSVYALDSYCASPVVYGPLLIETVERLIERIASHIFTSDLAMAQRLRECDEPLGSHGGQATGLLAMVVSDRDEHSRRLQRELALYNAATLSAASVEEALVHVEATKVDCVFIDLAATGTSSVQLVDRIRASSSNGTVPVIATLPQGGAGAQDLVDFVLAAGVNRLSEKPVHGLRLRRLMRALHREMVQDRRAYQRAQLQVPVTCEHDGEKTVGACVNISGTGMLLSLRRAISPHEAIRLSFALQMRQAAMQPFSISGAVARDAHQREAYGLVFRNPGPYQAESLHLRVAERLNAGARTPLPR